MTDRAPGQISGSPRSVFLRSCAVGALPAILVFGWMVSAGGSQFFEDEWLGDFYDAQARSLFDGRWDVPADAIDFERFAIDGRFYTYFGPWPALLRMPVLAVTDGFDGHLGRPSLLLAFVVLLFSASRLGWEVRALVRSDCPSRMEQVAIAGFIFVVGCGSPALFLGARAWAHHEAILWGLAWSVTSFQFLLVHLRRPTNRSLFWAGVTAVLAVLSRGTVGAGPVLALGLVFVVAVVHQAGRRASAPAIMASASSRLSRVAGVGRSMLSQPVWRLGAAAITPVVLYAWVNYAKFGSLFGLPLDQQDIQLQNPARQDALAASPSLFSLDFLPTNLVQYGRPDAIGLDRFFPWLTFSRPPSIFGGASFDTVEVTTSITATAALLVVLAVAGTIAVTIGARRDAEAPSLALLRIPVIAAAAATGGALLVGVQAQRYHGDFVPLLLTLAWPGLYWLSGIGAVDRPRLRRSLATGLVVLAAWSAWATFSTGLLYQRFYTPFQAPEVRAQLVDLRLDVADGLGYPPPSVDRAAAPPPHETARDRRLGTLVVIGDCDHVVLADRHGWGTVESRPDFTYRWRVAFGRPEVGMRMPLWSLRSADGLAGSILWIEWVDARRIRFEFESIGPPTVVVAGSRTLDVETGRPYDFDLLLNREDRLVRVALGSQVLFFANPARFDGELLATLGAQRHSRRGASAFVGDVQELPVPTPICDRLVGRSEEQAVRIG